MKEALVIFAKAPTPGQVKTRLIGALTAEQAAELYICFLRDTFALLEAVQEEREDLSLVLCYTPAEELEAFEAAEIEGCLLLSQRGNDLGERLSNSLADLAELGFTSIVTLGADSPTLPAESVLEAFAQLPESYPIVIGPARDGGFYLIGFHQSQIPIAQQLFQHIEWSSAQVLSQLQERLQQAKISFSLLPEWNDIDTPEELTKLKQQIISGDVTPKFTSRYLRKLFALR
jgi:uncharacterized protein